MSARDAEITVLQWLESVQGVTFSDIVHRDKPDFVVRHQGYETGIEVTSGSAEEFHRAIHLGKAANLEQLSVSKLRERSSDDRLPNEDLINVLQSVECVSSEESAVLWAERIAKRIRTKTRLMKGGELERFEKNWLCILNEQSDVSSLLSIEFYRAALMGAIGSDQSYREAFDLIFVFSPRNTFILDEQHLIAVRT